MYKRQDDVKVEQTDVDYLLMAFNSYFPSLNLGSNSVISQFAGLRPLVKNHVREASLISRDYALDIAPSGLITILGGKYTTYRLMAEKTVDAVLKQQNLSLNPCQTEEIPLCSFELSQQQISDFAAECHLPPHEVTRLAQQYGRACLNIFNLIKKSPHEGKQMCSEHPHIWAELTHAIQHEKAMTPEDWFERRTSIAYTSCKGLKCRDAVLDRFSSC